MPRVPTVGSFTARRAAWPLSLLALAALAPAARAAAPPSGTPTLTATVSAPTISYGAAVSISGELSASGQAIAGAHVQLQANSYPYRGYTTISTSITGADGTYAFTGVRPNRNTELRVIDATGATTISPARHLVVDPAGRVGERSLGAGRVALTLAVAHTGLGDAAPVSAYWSLAPRGSAAFHIEAVTQTSESGHLTTASATVDPPAARFSYRVCFAPAWRHAMGTSASYRRCVADTGLALEGRGTGTPAAPFPSGAAVAAAGRFIDGRAGSTAYAVVDDTGVVSGVRIHERFETASMVKVMMLVAYLQMLAAEHRGVDASSNAILYPMIHISDNNAASAVFAAVGGYPALERVAAQSQMTDFVPGVGWWAYTQTSAADQARFFFELDGLIPARFDGYARDCSRGSSRRRAGACRRSRDLGIRCSSRRGGLPSQGLFAEGALLERPGVRLGICVLTNGDPSMAYGEESIAGVGSALLSG